MPTKKPKGAMTAAKKYGVEIEASSWRELMPTKR